jgi:hypothetical protein
VNATGGRILFHQGDDVLCSKLGFGPQMFRKLVQKIAIGHTGDIVPDNFRVL